MDRTKKITKYLLLIVLVIFICIIAGVIYLYNEIFPKAEPINLPQIESVVSVALSYNTSDATLPISNENFENLLEYISTAKPTRRDASSDYPTEKSYYCIAVQTFEREYRYFIYKDGGYYIETPYEGVYETEAELFNSILSYYEETTTTPGILGEDVNVNSSDFLFLSRWVFDGQNAGVYPALGAAVTFSRDWNDGAPNFSYLEQCVDGQWYRLQYSQDNFGYRSVELLLGGAESTGLQGSIVQKYDYYGTRLESGTYRVVLEMKSKEGASHYPAAGFMAP